MRSGVIAQKVGMTRVFTETGEHIPVTVLKLGNCQVLGHRTTEKRALHPTARRNRAGLDGRPHRLYTSQRHAVTVAGRGLACAA